MDYTLAALKIFGSQLAGSTEAPSSEGSSPAQMIFGIRFQRAWMQGVLLSANYNEAGEGRLVLDDGSCVADLFVLPKEAEGRLWQPGMYVMVIGAYIAEQSKDNYPAIKVSSPSLDISSLSLSSCMPCSIFTENWRCIRWSTSLTSRTEKQCGTWK
ncbi:hypothetical protein GQ55_9G130300 [Panicum hallii var. hallii]|uniref:Uncharacterized protein n=1 Tax=Panicum hallii var. hallii TaxID=1504633 RepID=A0A2T7C2V5_9POAL|nr:hypothetical protein GQ55_9G130300 [Panicum hallii var. hallii]